MNLQSLHLILSQISHLLNAFRLHTLHLELVIQDVNILNAINTIVRTTTHFKNETVSPFLVAAHTRKVPGGPQQKIVLRDVHLAGKTEKKRKEKKREEKRHKM